MTINLKASSALSSQSFGDISNLQPFVFKPTGKPTHLPDDNDVVLAAPFPLFSIEMEGDTNYLTVAEYPNDGDVKLISLVCRETSPNTYEFLTHFEVNGNTKCLIVSNTSHSEMYSFCMNIAESLLNQLHSKSSAIGEVKARGRVKFKRDGKKQFYKANTCIYVGNKTSVTSDTITTACGQRVRHIKAWSVMGHWRKLNNPNTLGKDRHGDYTVKGYTWVKSYTKGDDVGRTCIRKVK